MSILSAFDDLGGRLLESAASEEFKQLLAELEDIEAEIKSLQQEVSDGWTQNYTKKLEDKMAEIQKVRKDLRDIIDSYEIEHFLGYDEDGHPEVDYEVDTVKQRKAAMMEATVRKKLEQVEAIYNALKKQLKQDHATAYTTQNRAIRTKTTSRDEKKKRKEELLRSIIEEERPELEQLIKKANEYTQVTADITKVAVNRGNLILSLTSSTSTIEVDPWDDVDYEDDYASVDVDKLVNLAEDHALDDGFVSDLAYGLGLDDDTIAQLDFTFDSKGGAVAIPGSTWKLLTDCDLDYDEPSVSVYKGEVSVDADFEYTVICYLIKEL